MNTIIDLPLTESLIESFKSFLSLAVVFGVIVLASKDTARFFRQLGLPLITGFIAVGIVTGPNVLQLINEHNKFLIHLVDEFALPFIALAAGSELHLEDFRRNLRTIMKVVLIIVCSTFAFGIMCLPHLMDSLSFATTMSSGQLLTAVILGSIVMVATSPSSMIAVIKELHARGPFTQVILGVTVILDSLVILLFAVGTSLADMLATSNHFDVFSLLFALLGIVVAIGIGIMHSIALRAVLSKVVSPQLKRSLIVLVGAITYVGCEELSQLHTPWLSRHITVEPMLSCMVGGFIAANYYRNRSELLSHLEVLAPGIFIIFFTAIGLDLNVSVLSHALPIVLAIVVVRLISIVIGGYLGGLWAGLPLKQNSLLGMVFMTQAGISLGLVKATEVTYPDWGPSFSAVFFGSIVLNTLIGPALCKLAISRVKEAHPRKETPDDTQEHSAIILGLDAQAIGLAQRLKAHHWQVILADSELERVERYQSNEMDIRHISDYDFHNLKALGAAKASTIVAMLDREQNYLICQLAYEHFGTTNLVVRTHGIGDPSRYQELGAQVVHPSMALVALLDHYVRTPTATNLLMGEHSDKDVASITIANSDLHNTFLRDLSLPADTLILAVKRDGQVLLSHGYTALKLGDQITIIGSPESLKEVSRRFQA